VLERVIQRGGTAVVPVFAVGRAQLLLHAIALLKSRHRLPHAIAGLSRQSDGDPQHRAVHAPPGRTPAGRRRLPPDGAGRDHGAHPEESKAIADLHGPKLILAASGMATGGRVLHHLAQYLRDHRNMVVLTGYQCPARAAQPGQGRRVAAHPWAGITDCP